MKPVHTANTYTVQIPEDDFKIIEDGQSRARFHGLDVLLKNATGKPINIDRTTAHVQFSVDVGSPDEVARAVEAVLETIRNHIQFCENVLMYVPQKERVDGNVAYVLYADNRYAYTSVRPSSNPLGDLGVALNFLYDGERQQKWFIDAAADQIRDIIDARQFDKLDRLTAKHIDIDEPNVRPRM